MSEHAVSSSPTLQGAIPTSNARSSAEALGEPSAVIATSFDELATNLSSQLWKCKETIGRERAALIEENHELRQKAQLVDSLRQENELLKERLQENENSTTLSIGHGAHQLQHDNDAVLARELEQTRNMLELELRRSSQYKHAQEHLKTRCEHYKGRLDRWRSFLQYSKRNLLARVPVADDVLAFISELESLQDPQDFSDESKKLRSSGKSAVHRQPLSLDPAQQPVQPKSETLADNTLEGSVWASPNKDCNALVKTISSNSTCSLFEPPAGLLPDDDDQILFGEQRVVPSSQDTQGESQALETCDESVNQIPNAQGSDPVVLYACDLKRKRPETTPVTHVKQERHSSPFSTIGLAALFSTQQVDLDDKLPAVVTPRKRQRIDNSRTSPHSDRKESLRVSQSKEIQKAPDSLSMLLSQADSVADFEDPDYHTLSAVESKPLVKVEPTVESLVGHKLKYSPQQTKLASSESSLDHRALRPLSVNARTGSSKHIHRKKSTSSKSDFTALPMDGPDSLSSQSSVDNAADDSSRDRPRTNTVGGRIQRLLETPTSRIKQLLTPRSEWNTLQSSTFRTKGENCARSSNARPQSNTKEQRRRGPTPETRPEDEPLRARPLHRLSLDDFKINLKNNKGVPFAYNEVIRGRQRQCLPDCARPECCGNQFQKMAEIGGFLPTPPGLWDSSQDIRDADERLLMDFLGEQDSQRLSSMTNEEKQKLLVEVKAKTLQSRWGKHRVAYPRSRTPPGFWRCDMPSTQEIEGDHALSEKMRRDMIAERRQEALKANGMWKFRDE